MSTKQWGVSELARALRVSTTTIYNRLKANTLPAPEWDGLRRVHYWRDHVVQQLLEEQKDDAQPAVNQKAEDLESLLSRIVKQAVATALGEFRSK